MFANILKPRIYNGCDLIYCHEKGREGSDKCTIQLISNDVCEDPKFKVIPKITYIADPVVTLSLIPRNVLIINDVRNCYMCKIGEIG